MNKFANFLRFFFGIFFLAGAVFNTYLTITNPDGYKNGGTTAWPPLLQHFWVNVVATHIVLFLILFILIEIALGLLLLNKGKWVKIGTICSNCADHWIDGKAYKAPRPKSKRTA